MAPVAPASAGSFKPIMSIPTWVLERHGASIVLERSCNGYPGKPDVFSATLGAP